MMATGKENEVSLSELNEVIRLYLNLDEDSKLLVADFLKAIQEANVAPE